jgi:drug/metabolite transporter (DMT)-like permease
MNTPNPNARQMLIGSACVVTAAIGFSSKAILIKLAYADNAQLDAITLMTWRMMLSLPFFVAVALWDREANPMISARDWLALIVLGVMGYYLASLLDFIGLEYISAGLERLILFLYPTMVVLLGAIIQRRPVDRVKRWALLLSYVGVALVFTNAPDAVSKDITLGGQCWYSLARWSSPCS